MIPSDVLYNYGVLKTSLSDYLTRNRALSLDGVLMRDDDAMLVDTNEGEKNAIDAIAKGKGKGKGKIKGKSKGKTPGKTSAPTPPTAPVRAIEG
eukprot:13884208-Heterocapsa_arctica.AAC.1